MFVIGMVYGGGRFWNRWQKPDQRFIDAVPMCDETRSNVESCMSNCDVDGFFVHWGNVPQGTMARMWMDQCLSLRENDYFIQLEPSEWDGCMFLKEVGPATPVL